MIITQVLCWIILSAVQRVAGTHSGVTRVLPVEGGLTDFRMDSTSSMTLQPPLTPQPPASAPSSAPAPLREESGPDPSVRFPNNADADLGGPHPAVRGVPSYPVWSSNAQGYIPRPAAQVVGSMQGIDPGIDSSASASGNAYRQVGEYIEEDSDHAEVSFRDEHHPSILIKNQGFNAVAVGFIVYLILLTVLQNSMLNWSQKGALLTLGPTTQRVQREAVDRATPISQPPVSTTTPVVAAAAAAVAASRDVDGRARVQPDLEVEDNLSRLPVSVAAVLNDADADDGEPPNGKTKSVGPRTLSQVLSQ